MKKHIQKTWIIKITKTFWNITETKAWYRSGLSRAYFTSISLAVQEPPKRLFVHRVWSSPLLWRCHSSGLLPVHSAAHSVSLYHLVLVFTLSLFSFAIFLSLYLRCFLRCWSWDNALSIMFLQACSQLMGKGAFPAAKALLYLWCVSYSWEMATQSAL